MFKGGYRFKYFEGSAVPELREFPVPENIFISTENRLFTSFEFLVHEGDRVSAGKSVLMSGVNEQCVLVAPVNGIVTGVNDNGVYITTDSPENSNPEKSNINSPWNHTLTELHSLVCDTGCWMLLNREFASPEDCSSIKYVIINAVHNGPLDQAWAPKMFGEPSSALDGIRILKALFPNSEISLTVNKRSRNWFSSADISDLANITVLSDKYPQEHSELLARDTVKQRLTSPDGERDPSILIIPYENVIQIAESLIQGLPLVDRIVMIAGPGVSQPGWYRIRIGTPFDEIRRLLFKSDNQGPWRIIRGNLFTGTGITSLETSIQPEDTEISVIREQAVRELWRFMNPGFTFDSYTKSTVAEYLPFFPRRLDSNVHGGERPCVQCNACDEVCPVDIYPFLIWKYVRADKTEDSFRYRPYDCIECGLCDYVCPSKITVSQSVIKASEEYRKSRMSDEVNN